MITFELKQLSLFIYFLMKLEFTAFLQKASEANIWMERSVILRNYMWIKAWELVNKMEVFQ